MTDFLDPNIYLVFANSAIDYVQNSFIPSLFTGDPMAIAVVGIIAIILLVVIFKVSGLIYALIKRIFLFLIILFSLYFFIANYADKLMAEGLTGQLIIVGVVGIAVGLIALIIALGAMGKHAKKVRKGEPKPVEELKELVSAEPSAPKVTVTQISQPRMFTQQALTTSKNVLTQLKNDRSLLAVLSYVIIAQFGIFSSNTIPVPSMEVGVGLFIAFFIGAFIFIKTTYHNYLTGVKHLVVAALFSLGLSILLGHYWALEPVPFGTLLSLEYFKSTSLIAFITGIAVSLLMGAKD